MTKIHRIIAGCTVVFMGALGISACSTPGNIQAEATAVFPGISQPDKYTLTIDEGEEKPTKVQTRILRKAPETAQVVTKNDTIYASYQGQTWDGKILETTYKYGQTPTPLPLNKLHVKGLTDGIVGHRVGELIQIVIPADKAYGDKGAKDPLGKKIVAPNMPLTYVVDIHDAVDLTDISMLKKATPRKGAAEDIPEGISVSGALGEEPTLKVSPSFVARKEIQVIILAQGTGSSIGPDDYAAVHAVVVPLTVTPEMKKKVDEVKYFKASSDWNQKELKLTPANIGTDRTFLGVKVGSRALVIKPPETGKTDGVTYLYPGRAMVVDYGAKLSTQH